MIETPLARYVPQDYQQNPETEDLFPDGRGLRNGMTVLIANPGYRMDMMDPDNTNPVWVAKILKRHTRRPKEDAPLYYRTRFDPSYECIQMDVARAALRMNRWCRISQIEKFDFRNIEDSISFIGIYDDRTEFSIFMPISEAWLVKKESVNAQATT